MSLVLSIKKRIDSWSPKQWVSYSVGFFMGILVLSGLLFYFTVNTIHALKSEFNKVNAERQQVRILLSKYDRIRQQKKITEDILRQENDKFKLKFFIDELLKLPELAKKSSSSSIKTTQLPELRSEGYQENSIEVSFNAINTKQLVDFLIKIEENDRVYAKNLEITQSQTPRFINVKVTIATLLPTLESSEIGQS